MLGENHDHGAAWLAAYDVASVDYLVYLCIDYCNQTQPNMERNELFDYIMHTLPNKTVYKSLVQKSKQMFPTLQCDDLSKNEAFSKMLTPQGLPPMTTEVATEFFASIRSNTPSGTARRQQKKTS